MIFVFWFSIAVISYAYAGYPLLLVLMSALLRKEVKKKAAEPKVSVILSAFNEEKAIQQKITNLLSLDYPPEKLEILVGSDGGSDRTDEIVSEVQSPQVRFFRFVKNLGKPHVLSVLVEEAHGSILVFTDTRQELDPQAIRALVANFEDPEVGCVSGELFFKNTSEKGATVSVARGMGAYWGYEKFLRKKESELGSMLGATGALYAVRRKLFPDLAPDILADDLYIPLAIVEKGYRAVFDSEARAYDRPSECGREEFKRKVRTLAGNYQIFSRFPELLIPFKSPVAFQLFSHKFLRLVIPFLLTSLGVSNLFLLGHSLYAVFFWSQALFYGLAFWEALGETSARKKKGIGYLPYTFCLLNYSAFVALIRFLRPDRPVGAWEKAYA